MIKKQYIFDVETMGLEPMEDRIICISIIDLETNNVKTFINKNESKVLTDFWNEMQNAQKLIGFNSDSFDLPFLIKRSLINKIKLNPNIKHLDIRKAVNGFWYSYNKYSKGTLREWAKILGINIQTTSGKSIPQLFVENELDEIKKHCEEDTKITLRLFELCKYCNIIFEKKNSN